MRSYHRITRDVKCQGWSNGMASSTRHDIVRQIKSLLNNMFIIYLFLTLLWFYNLFWSLIPKNCGNVCHYVTFLDLASSCFPSLVPCLTFTVRNVAAKTGNDTDVSLVLKDSDIQIQKTPVHWSGFCIRWPENRQFKRCIIYRYIINKDIQHDKG